MIRTSIRTLLGTDDFSPNYEFEKSIEFNARVEWFMKSFYDPLRQPELYVEAVKAAVEYANKAIMMDKLGVEDDLEATNPELFKSTFAKLAKRSPRYIVNGTTVQLSLDLTKSETSSSSVNEAFEFLWKETFDTLRQEAACRGGDGLEV